MQSFITTGSLGRRELGGSDRASTLATGPVRHQNLDSWTHLLAREGQFGAAYKASLVNLGLFRGSQWRSYRRSSEEAGDLNEAVQSVEVTTLSDRGSWLAEFSSLRSKHSLCEGSLDPPHIPCKPMC